MIPVQFPEANAVLARSQGEYEPMAVATPYASSPGDYAWCVSFSSGYSGYALQDYQGLVRAVRVGRDA